MKSYKIFNAIALLLILVVFFSCKKSDEGGLLLNNSAPRKFAVVITPNTAMRIDPLVFSSRVALLKKGDFGEVIDRTTEEKRVGSNRNYWYKIKLSNGIQGWVFGENLNILENADSDNVESYLGKFWEKESEELKKELHGKWWSVNRFNDFTNHCLEIYNDGRYKSYLKGATKKLEGEYNFDFNKSQIIFLGETSFEGNLYFIKRGDVYTLYRESDKDEIKFKKINVNPESENEDSTLVKKSQEEEEKQEKNESETE